MGLMPSDGGMKGAREQEERREGARVRSGCPEPLGPAQACHMCLPVCLSLPRQVWAPAALGSGSSSAFSTPKPSL